MTSFWSKHTWFRRTISTLVIVLAVCIVVLLSIAYVYMPRAVAKSRTAV